MVLWLVIPQQAHTLDLMIGKCSMLHNLYVFTAKDFQQSVFPASLCSSLVADGNLWHHRLGHLSSAKLLSLSPQLHLSKALIHPDHCKICPLAKKRLSFPFNNNLAKEPFDLVHLDVWGLFATETIEGYK